LDAFAQSIAPWRRFFERIVYHPDQPPAGETLNWTASWPTASTQRLDRVVPDAYRPHIHALMELLHNETQSELDLIPYFACDVLDWELEPEDKRVTEWASPKHEAEFKQRIHVIAPRFQHLAEVVQSETVVGGGGEEKADSVPYITHWEDWHQHHRELLARLNPHPYASSVCIPASYYRIIRPSLVHLRGYLTMAFHIWNEYLLDFEVWDQKERQLFAEYWILFARIRSICSTDTSPARLTEELCSLTHLAHQPLPALPKWHSGLVGVRDQEMQTRQQERSAKRKELY
jgi:hypothetical protein